MTKSLLFFLFLMTFHLVANQKSETSSFELEEVRENEFGKEMLNFIQLSALPANELTLFADNLYSNAEKELVRAKFNHKNFQKICKTNLKRLKSNQDLFEKLMFNVTAQIKLTEVKASLINNKREVVNSKMSELLRHYNRNEMLRALWTGFVNKTKSLLLHSISQAKHLKSELYDVGLEFKRKQSFVQIDPSNEQYSKLRTIMLDIVKQEGPHHYGYNTAVKSIVHVVKSEQGLNKKQIKLIGSILKQYTKFSKSYIKSLEEKTKRLGVFYNKYKTTLEYKKTLLNKEMLLLDRKTELYRLQKGDYELVYNKQKEQLSVLNQVFKRKSEMCTEEKKEFKKKLGDLLKEKYILRQIKILVTENKPLSLQ